MTAILRQIHTQDSEAQADAVRFCSDALASISEKKLAAFVGTVFMRDGSYRTFSTRTVSHHEMVGILMDAIHDACEDTLGANIK